MRLPLLAAVAFAAAVEAAPTGPKTCANDGECGDDEFCRVSVAASGGACEAAVQTCAKLSVRGEQCGGGGGAAQDCFRNRCKSPLRCRENGVDAELPGTCVKECDIGGGVTVLEGWTGPVEGAGKWCHTSYCDGSDETAAGGVLKTSGGDAGAACPTGLADGLRCCVGAGESGQVCCGTSGAWVTPDGKARCGKVLAKGDSTGAPFSVTCTGVCARTGAAAVDDGWRGPSAEDGEWCNACVCARGKLACTERVCPTLRCCSAGDKKAKQVCCGASGEWVEAAGDTVACGGVTLAYADGLATQPFVAACGEKRGCTLVSNVEVRFPHGEKRRDPRDGRGCNECECEDGTLVCEGGVCGAAQCCGGATKPTDGGVYVCCGLDGGWKKVEEAGRCGSHATQVAGRPGGGYPFFEACAGQCAANTAAGGPGEEVPVGWTGRKGSFVEEGGSTPTAAGWCDTCACGVAAGAPAGTAPVVTCTRHAGCPEVGCCPSPAPTPVDGYACCGVSRRWVRVAEGEVLCGGVTVAAPPPAGPPAAPLGAVCDKHCTLAGGVVLGDGQSGRAAGAEWCKLCRCEGGTPLCTKDACEKRCCALDKPTKPAGAVWRCCGATGGWARKDAADTYSCGGALVADGAAQLHADPEGTGTDAEKGICETVVEADTRCKLHNAAETVVEQGWSGPGLGVNWCHTCRCGAADVRGKVSCPTGPCPAAEKLLCCAKTKGTGEACCGLTGEWVASDKMCGAVDLGVAGTDAGTAPVAAACVKCTLPEGGAEVAVGWFDFAPGANWCNKCYCAADGELKCTQRVCRAPTCCARPKGAGTDACCGATGDWVAVGTGADAGKYACGGVAVAKADTDKLPFFEACTTGCVLPDATPVAVDWAGKKGDGCNYCKCVSDGVLRCSTRVCPPTPSPPPAPTPPPTPPPAVTCRSYACTRLRIAPGFSLRPLADKPGKDDIVCSATGCTAHRCCDWLDGTILSPGGGVVAHPADMAPHWPRVPEVMVWVLDCEGRVPQVNLDSFHGAFYVRLNSYDAANIGTQIWYPTASAGAEHIGGAYVLLYVHDTHDRGTFSVRYKCLDP